MILGCVRMVDPIYVARAEKDSRLKVVKQIKSRAMDGRWPPTLIFPEGVRTQPVNKPKVHIRTMKQGLPGFSRTLFHKCCVYFEHAFTSLNYIQGDLQKIISNFEGQYPTFYFNKNHQKYPNITTL